MEIGEYILFIHKGEKWWDGDNEKILKTDNKELLAFVNASGFLSIKKANS
jgi:phospholipid/cholesterol/gamma-HCH transport system ATP-binding protein